MTRTTKSPKTIKVHSIPVSGDTRLRFPTVNSTVLETFATVLVVAQHSSK